jgi:hypothetical protein
LIKCTTGLFLIWLVQNEDWKLNAFALANLKNTIVLNKTTDSVLNLQQLSVYCASQRNCSIVLVNRDLENRFPLYSLVLFAARYFLLSDILHSFCFDVVLQERALSKQFEFKVFYCMVAPGIVTPNCDLDLLARHELRFVQDKLR